jgi:PAS domain S-box-containing protein
MQTKPRPSVQTLLFRLILVCLLPATLLVGVMLFVEYKIDRKELEQEALKSARSAVQEVDQQLAETELLAQTLATSGTLLRNDLAGFHKRVLRLMNDSNSDLSAALYDFNGQQLLNTVAPFGQPLSKRTNLEPIHSVFATGKMPPQKLMFRLSGGGPVVRTFTPVYAGNKVVYVLGVGGSIEKMSTALNQIKLPSGSVASIIDSSGIIAARTLDGKTFIGKKGRPDIFRLMHLKSEGIVETKSVEDAPLIVSYSKSSRTGWGVIIEIPRKTLEAPLRQTLALFGIVAGLILFLSLSMAWLMGNRISKSVRTLRATVAALGAGTLTKLPATHLRETEELSKAMEDSARLLATRTQALVTANKALEERTADLVERTTELKEAQHIAKTGHWKWDASAGEIVVSDELHLLYGPKILLPFAEQRGEVYPEAAWQELKTALQSKSGFSLLLPTLTEYGTRIWTRVIGKVVCNAAGDVTDIHGTLQDVDDYVKAELETQESANGYRTLFDEFPEAIVVHIHAEIAFANTAATKLFAAATAQDLVGKTIREFLHPDFQQVVAARFSSIAQSGEPSPPIEMMFITTKGQTFIGEAHSKPLLLEGKRYIQTYVRDLTEQKHREAEIAQLQTELQAMLVLQGPQRTAADLTQESNQPLARASLMSGTDNPALVTYDISEATEADADETKQLEQTPERTARDTEHADSMLQNLLVSTNQPDITRAIESLNTLVDEAIQASRKKGLLGYQIMTDCTADLPPVNVNRQQVVKVLSNLINDAAQTMYRAQNPIGKIHISTALASDSREVCVSVRYDSPGLNAALTEADGGKLWRSQEDGRGAMFHFTLPIADSTNTVQDALT